MTKQKAIEIATSHIDYILHNVSNNHTPEEISEAIEIIAMLVKTICEYNCNTLKKYNQWRRREINNYPTSTYHNMNILNESILIISEK
jgi:hypothetical protein